MPRPTIRTTLFLATLLIATGAPAGEVYQWKDASGVTHYSQSPPKTGAYRERNVSAKDSAAATPAAEPAPAAGTTNAAAATSTTNANTRCATARSNIELLQSKTPVQLDSDGDGKPDKTLDDTDRANQLQLAQATLKVECGAPNAKS